jgi:hypothetical protein
MFWLTAMMTAQFAPPAGQLGPHGHIKLEDTQGWFDEGVRKRFA